MREIKFRAWDKKQKFMFKIFDSVNQEDWYLPCWKEQHEIMQFIGLLDKNGKEIYEGDVVKYKNVLCVVGWDNENACWIIDAEREIPKSFTKVFHHECSVIGNIFANPGLLP